MGSWLEELVAPLAEDPRPLFSGYPARTLGGEQPEQHTLLGQRAASPLQDDKREGRRDHGLRLLEPRRDRQQLPENGQVFTGLAEHEPPEATARPSALADACAPERRVEVEAPQEAEHATQHPGTPRLERTRKDPEAPRSGTVEERVAAKAEARAEEKQWAGEERVLMVEELSRLREENARMKKEQERLMGQVRQSQSAAQEHQRLHEAARQRVLELQSQLQAEQACSARPLQDLQAALHVPPVFAGPVRAVGARSSSVPPVRSAPARPRAPASSSFRPFTFLLSAFLTDSDKQELQREQPAPEVV